MSGKDWEALNNQSLHWLVKNARSFELNERQKAETVDKASFFVQLHICSFVIDIVGALARSTASKCLADSHPTETGRTLERHLR